MNPIQRFVGRFTEFITTSMTGPLITRVRSVVRRWHSTFRPPTHTYARSDYDYYARLYRGQVLGLEVSGLLVKPVVSKLALWTLGRAPRWQLGHPASQAALTDWWATAHPDILRAWRSALRDGDAFLVVNSDMSLTLLPPGSVDPLVADDDFSRVVGWRVTQVMEHPDLSRRMAVVDEYYVDRRVHRIEVDGRLQQEQVYPNLLGRLPLVHIPNQPDAGDTFGHPEAEALLPLLHKYGEVFTAAIEGNVLQGRPTPVLTFDTVDDLEKFDTENAVTAVHQLPDGRQEQVKTYEVDLSQLLVASGATFEYKAPGSFTGDTAKLLEILFYLLLEHAELPEFVMGNAISSSKASAETQMPVFEKFIEGRRIEMASWLVDLAEIALGYLALLQPGVVTDTPLLQWQPVTQDDRMTLDALTWAYAERLIDRRTALQLAPFDLEDVDAVLAAVDQEAVDQQDQFPETAPDERQFDRDLADQLDQLEI